MGVWMMAVDRIKIDPPVDDNLIREFIEFGEISCPKSYCREKFYNTWFFDAENNMICGAGKFAEPHIWYEHLQKYFFTPLGYTLPAEIEIIAEGEGNFWEIAESRNTEYNLWLERKDRLTKRKYEGQFEVIIPAELHQKAVSRARRMNRSLNEFVKKAIERECSY